MHQFTEAAAASSRTLSALYCGMLLRGLFAKSLLKDFVASFPLIYGPLVLVGRSLRVSLFGVVGLPTSACPGAMGNTATVPIRSTSTNSFQVLRVVLTGLQKVVPGVLVPLKSIHPTSLGPCSHSFSSLDSLPFAAFFLGAGAIALFFVFGSQRFLRGATIGFAGSRRRV